LFLVALFLIAVASGATAAVAGFGIGSLLTPLFAVRFGMTTAIAAVAIPHAIATAVRGWRLRHQIDWHVIRTFGVLSAVGAIAGALLYTRFTNRALTLILGVLLLATAIAGLSNWMRRWQPTPIAAGIFGFASGLFGGVAGNQGGLRAAALFAFPLSPAAFVATSTASGVFVDAGRLPVYVWRAGDSLIPLLAPISIATIGVLLGTVLGERVLFGLSPERFRKIVSTLIGLLGIWLIARSV